MRGYDVKIYCVCVDTATTRNDLEMASRHYWERLCSDLRAEASSRLVAVVEFLSFVSKELERRPRDVEEVGLAYEAHARIEMQLAGIAEEVEAVAVLAKVMAAWTSEKLDGNVFSKFILNEDRKLKYLFALRFFRRKSRLM